MRENSSHSKLKRLTQTHLSLLKRYWLTISLAGVLSIGGVVSCGTEYLSSHSKVNQTSGETEADQEDGSSTGDDPGENGENGSPYDPEKGLLDRLKIQNYIYEINIKSLWIEDSGDNDWWLGYNGEVIPLIQFAKKEIIYSMGGKEIENYISKGTRASFSLKDLDTDNQMKDYWSVPDKTWVIPDDLKGATSQRIPISPSLLLDGHLYFYFEVIDNDDSRGWFGGAASVVVKRSLIDLELDFEEGVDKMTFFAYYRGGKMYLYQTSKDNDALFEFEITRKEKNQKIKLEIKTQD